jgi:lactoylglutathione lyase
MKFLWTTIVVKDLEQSLRFYKEIVGLKEHRRFNSGHGEIVFLGDGETEIELMTGGQEKELSYGQDISLGFEVESLEELMTTLKEKEIDILAGPISPNPMVKFIFVHDPNGLKIQFVENAK